MFASQTTGQLTFENGDGTSVVVTIQKLNWQSMRRAQEEQSTRAMAMAAKAGPELLQMWNKENTNKPPVASTATDQETREQQYRAYDRETVLLKGVRSWTASIDLAQGLGDLDEPTADRLHRAILDLSLPPMTKEAAAEKRGES